MTEAVHNAKWQPVDLVNWTRRAYGRTVMMESDGGTLRSLSKLPSGQASKLYLKFEVRGRVLMQVYCNGAMVCEDLVEHGECDRFVDLELAPSASMAELELHLIPATNGAVRIAQNFQLTKLTTPLDCVMAPAAN
mgnify:CR=1 FL=1